MRWLKDRWEAHVRLFFGAGLPRPKRGDVWKINAVRMRRTEGLEDSALVIGAGGYHCPERFRPLQFVWR